MTIIGCCVSGTRKSAMITECWTPQSNHRDTFFSIYRVIYCILTSTGMEPEPDSCFEKGGSGMYMYNVLLQYYSSIVFIVG